MANLELGIPVTDHIASRMFDTIRGHLPEFLESSEEDILRRNGKDVMLAALAHIKQIPFLKRISHLVDRVMVDKLGTDLLKKAQALPLTQDKASKQILIAIADTNNGILEDQLRQTGLYQKIDRVIVPIGAINEVLERSMKLTGPSQEEIDEIEVYDRGKEVVVFDLQAAHEDPIVRLLCKMFLDGITQGASDIHLRCDIHPELYYHYRVDGDLRAKQELDAKIKDRLDAALLSQVGINTEERAKSAGISGRIQIRHLNREISIRYERTASYRGYHITLRILDKSGFEPKLGVDTLVFPRETLRWIYKVLESPYGIIVMSGPTGSGKSTTLNAMLREINRSEINILTLENPVEDEINGIIHHQMRDAKDFPHYMKSFMRSDPNKMFIGEVRDKETAEASIEAALTGHQVLTTIHVNTAAQIVERFEQLGVERYKLGSTLKACLAQRLVKTLCPSCKRAVKGTHPSLIDLYNLDNQDLKIPLYQGDVDWKDGTFYEPQEGGCGDCGNTGFRGRLPIMEMIPVDEEMQALLMRPNTTYLDVQKTAREKFKLPTLKQEGLRLVLEGTTTLRAVAQGVELTF
jgi:type II secretory ATPase GspE/PulE/Tfp pilus assembly ATPase PilB-like protein